jgi:lipopolysaccharide/colanic/teichoic acid biosynthesis glycosyltransferase
MKRLFDIIVSFFGLLFFSIFLLPVMFLVWRQDKYSPLYISERVGINGSIFQMVKLRSMLFGADKSGVDSTSSDDLRITPIGQFVRKYKLDEITQLWNVLIGDMSLVGPRPNVSSETDLYTQEEQKLLSVKPGITDFASIVFSDEGQILEGKKDPNLAYNQLIRPWKSRLGLIYIQNCNLSLDISILFYTLVAIVSKKKANEWVSSKIKQIGADLQMVDVARRQKELIPSSPPGSAEVVTSR